MSTMTRYLTPPEYAARLGVKPSKVLSWISRGDLMAVNIAGPDSTRPRWRISPEAIADFERRRAARPGRFASRRRARQHPDPGYITYV